MNNREPISGYFEQSVALEIPTINEVRDIIASKEKNELKHIRNPIAMLLQYHAQNGTKADKKEIKQILKDFPTCVDQDTYLELYKEIVHPSAKTASDPTIPEEQMKQRRAGFIISGTPTYENGS